VLFLQLVSALLAVGPSPELDAALASAIAAVSSPEAGVNLRSDIVSFVEDFVGDADARSETYSAFAADALELEKGRNAFIQPLWPEGVAPEGIPMLHRDWHARGGGWAFWAEWYEGYLTGKPLDLDLLEKVALIEPEDWDKGDDHVNGIIASIYEEWKSQLADIDRPQFNLALVERQTSVLRDYIVGELERVRGRNSTEDADLPRLELIRELLQQALEAVDEILERLASPGGGQSTALVVVEERLPIVVDAADRLSTEAAAPMVSQQMLLIAATVKVLTDAGLDPKDAARLASADVLGPKLIAWFRSWLLKRK
jgi:hypothetical protein